MNIKILLRCVKNIGIIVAIRKMIAINAKRNWSYNKFLGYSSAPILINYKLGYDEEDKEYFCLGIFYRFMSSLTDDVCYEGQIKTEDGCIGAHAVFNSIRYGLSI